MELLPQPGVMNSRRTNRHVLIFKLLEYLFHRPEVVKDWVTDRDCAPRAFVTAALGQPLPRREPFLRWRKMNDDAQLKFIGLRFHCKDNLIYFRFAKERKQISDARKLAAQWLQDNKFLRSHFESTSCVRLS